MGFNPMGDHGGLSTGYRMGLDLSKLATITGLDLSNVPGLLFLVLSILTNILLFKRYILLTEAWTRPRSFSLCATPQGIQSLVDFPNECTRRFHS